MVEMASATHPLQISSCGTCPLRFSSWSSGNTLRDFVTNHTSGQKDQFISLKCKSYLGIGAPLLLKPKGKSLKISAFKRNGQNQSGRRAGGSKSPQDSVKLSYVPKESEETSVESTSTQNGPISYHAGEDETTNYSSIRSMLKGWLTVLHTPSSNKIMDGTLEETSFSETLEIQDLIQKKDKGQVLKAVWCHFQSLDATIKIPLLALIPLYLVVNLVYGSEVSRELAPLWILGPCLLALYIKMFRSICAVYVFSFKKTLNVAKNFPMYYLLTYDYIARGKLKEDIRDRLLHPMVDFKNSEYKKLAKTKVKDLELLLVDKYLDFLELIWPCYCRTLRFLKRTNFI